MRNKPKETAAPGSNLTPNCWPSWNHASAPRCMINNHTGIRKTEGFGGFCAELATKALNYAGLAKMAPGAS